MIRIGMLTSGGDCQSLNATMRGVAKSLYKSYGDEVEIIGFEDGYKGLIYADYRIMKPSDFSGILTEGGTILGTSRQPFKLMRVPDENGLDKVEAMKHTYRKLKLECLVVLGGNGSQKTANLLREEGLNIVSLPKTIDNDLWGTDMTFGFQSAVNVATDAIDCIHTTAASHGRVFIVEVMGHKVGWLTLHAGIAGGADIILIPEIPYNIDKVIEVSQDPIGRTPRSNPATYTGVFDIIRDLFAGTNEAKLRGYSKGRFSFNVAGGRCEACNGDGVHKIEMQFLADVYVPCEVCKGTRYNYETLEVKYKGKSIADVLDMTVEEALEFFDKIPKIKQKIQTLYDVGLGYIKLGQPSTTLSGGEAQRVKLATELSKRATGKTLYILDEPTTGLHIADVHKLVDILQRLVDTGNSIIVIEHNLDLIKTADYIIDLGPEGGNGGGQIVAVGSPEQICKNEQSYTGKFLKKYL